MMMATRLLSACSSKSNSIRSIIELLALAKRITGHHVTAGLKQVRLDRNATDMPDHRLMAAGLTIDDAPEDLLQDHAGQLQIVDLRDIKCLGDGTGELA